MQYHWTWSWGEMNIINFCNLGQPGSPHHWGFLRKWQLNSLPKNESDLTNNYGNKKHSRRAVILSKVLNLEEFSYLKNWEKNVARAEKLRRQKFKSREWEIREGSDHSDCQTIFYRLLGYQSKPQTQSLSHGVHRTIYAMLRILEFLT